MTRRTSLLIYLALAIAALAACICIPLMHGSAPMSGNVEIDSAAATQSWRIAYNPTSTWGKSAAELLADALSKRFANEFLPEGISLSALPADGSPTITVGQLTTYRDAENNDALLLYRDQLGEDGWAILPDAPNLHLIASSAEGALAAIEALCTDIDQQNLTLFSPAVLRAQSHAEPTASGDERSSLLSVKHPLCFGNDDRFTMLLFSDLSAGISVSPYTVNALEALVKAEQPDLVLLCGGAADGFATIEELTVFLTALTAPLEEAGVPWAHLYAGADTLPRARKDSVYAAFPYCVSKSGDYFLPITTTDGLLSFGVWMLSLPEDGSDTYSEAQLSAFAEQAAQLAVPSIMALAAPLPEFAEVANEPLSGTQAEAISAPDENCGLFALAKENGVRAIYAGRDHLNDYCGLYDGVELGALASLGYDGYGFGGTFEINHRLRGGRVVEVTAEGEVSSHMVYAKDHGIER